ncbi:MAG: hypothetical protein RLZZ584_3420, partial [Pseudomonadota bacterium]
MNTPQPLNRVTIAQPAVRALALLTLVLSIAWPDVARSASADIANQPLGTGIVSAKPNLMFILDDSGSMDSDYMPDDMGGANDRYGYYSVQCNGLAFDPNLEYPTPLRADGTSYPNASYTAAPTDGYVSGTTTINLATAVRNNGLAWNVYYRYTGSQTPRNWLYAADGARLSTDFTSECFSNIGSTPGSGVFVLETVTAALQVKYANWYSYYRKRYLLMRSAVGHAFEKMDSNYRVGFTVISDEGVSGAEFLDTADFNATHKTSFYNMLYSVRPNGFTPLRGSLSKVGSYFGKAVPGQTYDPAAYRFTDPVTGATSTRKYECQRNFALLSTDGYWNTGGDFTAKYKGGFDLAGVQVGQQDGDEARPMKDGTSSLKIRTTTLTRTDTNVHVDRTATRTGRWTRTRYTNNNSNCNAGQGRDSGRQWRVRTQEATSQTLQLQTFFDITYTATRTLRIVNGVEQLPATTTAFTEVSRAQVGTPTYSAATANWNNTGSTDQCFPVNAQPANEFAPSADGTLVGNYTETLGAAQAAAGGTTGTVQEGTPTEVDSTTTGDPNTLADIAEYYYKNDLRSDIPNNVKPLGVDNNTGQHMQTYTLGLGVNGTLPFDPDYLIKKNPDGSYMGTYGDLVSGAKVWPTPSLLATGNTNATHVDDLWHAAVNGRGQYFSANSKEDLTKAIATTLSDVGRSIGTASAAASSTLTPSATDDWLFISRYNSSPTWNGELFAFKFTFDATTGDLIQPDTSNAAAAVFTVQAALNNRTTARNIFFNSGGTRTPFVYGNLSAAQKASFDNRCTTNSPVLAQCATIATDTTNGTARLANATGANLVNFITGDNTYKLDAADVTRRVWRARAHRLGDIAHASPVYVGKPGFKYVDTGYAAFVAARSSRTQVVYAGANDGMLHAFLVNRNGSATTANPGDELWAFVPTPVIPNLWRLADSVYDESHRYYVDATPNVADVFDGTNWRTILVGGLGAGGRGFYALDVTDPLNPSVLWEYTSADDANLGLSFGNPIITKTKDGTWVVAFTSGYNNVLPGDGVGRLYIRNAVTGAEIHTLSTGVGSTDTPSNLGRINAWVVRDTDNTALRFYGGDMLGNLWRFDHDDLTPPSGAEAFLLGRATTPAGGVQPITAKPMLTEIVVGAGSASLVSFGTGRYLGDTDLTDATVQSIYVVKDALLGTGLGDLRGGTSGMVQRNLAPDRTLVAVPAPAPLDWTTSNGFHIDLTLSARERIYLDAVPVVPGVMSVASTIPNGDPCSAGGESWIYDIELNGGLLQQATHYDVPIVGLGRVVSASGPRDLVTTQDGLAQP